MEQIRRQILGVLGEVISIVLEYVEEEIARERERPQRVWQRNWVARRVTRGASSELLQELAVEDTQEYYYALRLTENSFKTLLDRVAPVIQRSDTHMRCALPAKVKLHAILYMMAHGSSLRTLLHLFRLPKPTVSKMISEVCDAIYNALQNYIRVPDKAEEWSKIERGFRNAWNFPGCCGAIDGKHVTIKAPVAAGSYYYNYKKLNSIVLMAVVDSDYCFSYIDIGCNGRISDGGVFSNCTLSAALENNLLPEGYVIVGDNAFPLKKYLMKPYGGNNLEYKYKIFNYRLSRARRIVENAFGILVSRFRIFEKPLPYEPGKVEKIVKAACAIHNWVRKSNISVHVATVDIENNETGTIQGGSWRDVPSDGLIPIQWRMQNRSSDSAQAIRESYADYFVGDGAVPWQSRMVY